VGVTAALRKSVSLFFEQERAVAKVAGALKVAGVYSNAVLEDIQNWASALQKVTVYGDEAALASYSMAKNMGATVEQAKTLVEAAAEMSAIFGQDLQTSTRQIAVTLGGMSGELGEKFPAIRAMTPEQRMAGGAASYILGQFRGTAAELAQTQGGQLAQAMNRLGDSMEELGSVLAPIAVKLAEGGAWTASAAARNIKTPWLLRQLMPESHPAFQIPSGPGKPNPIIEMRARVNKYLGQAGLPSVGMGLRNEDLQRLDALSGGIGAGSLGAAIASSKTPLEKLQEERQTLIRARNFMSARAEMQEMRAPGPIGDAGGAIGALNRRIGQSDLAISRMQSPHIHQFADDLGMSVQQSLSSALRTAFTGGSARDVAQQFGNVLSEAVIGALAQGIAEKLVGDADLLGSLADLAMTIGGSSGGGK